MKKPPVFVAGAVLIDERTGRFLISQRPPGKQYAGYWEFPGGKVNMGESPEAACVRELREELNIDIALEALEPWTFLAHTYPEYQVIMLLYVCRHWSGELIGLEGQAFQWVTADEAKSIKILPGDVPLLPKLAALMPDFTPLSNRG
ncbi:MAG: (deoxy)nucleoside triphosphate pyrophosphohydrolase [Alphaproteobacteria bacterium]|nr:(deoxy)nucleoside triphosphate pyrophosphohydrolase [Thalassospira sp.]MCE2964590.1 (deoxy)nucleoside triphosphate pyrophosphohydrolase [Alphaproteobacteria bacterium]